MLGPRSEPVVACPSLHLVPLEPGEFMRPKIDNPVQFLRENGILFEINRQVLHPLGLEVDVRLDPSGAIAEVELADNRDQPDAICFTAEEFNEGRARYEDYLAARGRQNIRKRRELGMVIQTGPSGPGADRGDDDEG